MWRKKRIVWGKDLCSACLQEELGDRIPPSRRMVTFPLDDEADFEEEPDISQKEQLQKDLTQSLQQLAQVQETQPLLEQKIQDLETQLFNLAKQKLKGKKEAQRVLTE